MQKKHSLWIAKPCYNSKRRKKGRIQLLYACTEHIELALDVAVDEWEVAPKIEKTTDDNDATCTYCGNKATYTVAK
ncbi:CxxH/CxxC protein [Shouchella clausii]|uniref:CxxH/CxxC protein n=1 Tax=Shouchella clausii TaxID=79880 RepID=UPI003461FC7A